MHNIDLIEILAEKTGSKIAHIVLDGLGDIHRTDSPSPLEAANTPNLDALAVHSSLGVADPIFPGVTPGSGPGHLALFGYDPLKNNIGRGVLEALGIGLELKKDALYTRGNFCIIDDKKIITDRRAGRISTEENAKICEKINMALSGYKDTQAKVFPVKDHRFVVEFLDAKMDPGLTDADAQKEGRMYKYAEAVHAKAEYAKEKVNNFIDFILDTLKGDKVNGILLRGFARDPGLSGFAERFKLNAAAIAQYPMYKGLASLVRMKLLDAGEAMTDIPSALEEHFKDFDYFFIHVKKTDSYGEDGNFEGKKHIIEEFDAVLPRILALAPDSLIITGDHSTPFSMKSHSWHPVPVLLHSKYAIHDEMTFNERNAARGSLGRFNAIYEIPLLMAHAGKLAKYGA